MPNIFGDDGELVEIDEEENIVEPEEDEEDEDKGGKPDPDSDKDSGEEDEESDLEDEELEDDDEEDEDDEEKPDPNDGEQDEFGDMSQEDIELEARRQGWVPPEEYRGDKTRAVDAKEFLRRGQEILPIVNAQLSRERERVARLEDELSKINKMNRTAMKKQAEKIKADLEARRKESREMNDWDSFDEADSELKQVEENLSELERQEKEEEEAKNKGSDQPKVDIEKLKQEPEVKSFLERNPWYFKDERMTVRADVLGQIIRKENPEMPAQQYFAELEKQMRGLYPDKFKTPTRNKPHSAASSAGRGSDRSRAGGEPSGKKTFADLPKEAKAAYKEQKAEGLWKNKEEYVELYFADEE